jgi:hypothetical protein
VLFFLTENPQIDINFVITVIIYVETGLFLVK